jgi:hypothetical protein
LKQSILEHQFIMSRRSARFTQAELDRMARTVRATGVAIEVVHDGATMRIMPHLPSSGVARNAADGFEVRLLDAPWAKSK